MICFRYSVCSNGMLEDWSLDERFEYLTFVNTIMITRLSFFFIVKTTTPLLLLFWALEDCETLIGPISVKRVSLFVDKIPFEEAVAAAKTWWLSCL